MPTIVAAAAAAARYAVVCGGVHGWPYRAAAAAGISADIGTGTGLLAFAALHLWPRATAIASDIDPVSVRVSAENAAENGVMLGSGAGQLALVAADGTGHPAIAARASMFRNNRPVTKADRMGMDDNPFNCCKRLMMLLAFSYTGTSKIELTVKITDTMAASCQWLVTGRMNLS